MSVSDSPPLDYYLKLVPQGQFYQIALETLSQQRDKGKRYFCEELLKTVSQLKSSKEE